jgi:predicted dienelactone hydrolase
VALHLVIEGGRWQMVPVYVIVAVLAALAGISFARGKDFGPAISVPALVLLVAATAIPILVPMPVVSASAGAYKVGTRIYQIEDGSRKELYSGRDEARRFMIQVWYPAEPRPGDARAPWLSDAKVVAPAIARFMGLPSFFLDHLALVRVPAWKDAPAAPSKGGFPLILFSHGWNGFAAQNTAEALLLASRGYVVVAVQHTYGAVVTVFPDGRVAPNNPAALPDGAPTAEYETAGRRLVAQWAGDLSYALGWMEARAVETGNPLSGLVDPNRVGVYGHSTGGGAAIQFAATDPRCRAVLGLDAFMRPVSEAVLDGGVAQPSFFMFSQVWTDDTKSRNNELFARFRPNASKCLGVVTIAGTAHLDFSDLPLLTPLAPLLGLKGPINGKRVTAIVDDYLLAFFDLNLKGAPTTLFDGTSPWKEVSAR